MRCPSARRVGQGSVPWRFLSERIRHRTRVSNDDRPQTHEWSIETAKTTAHLAGQEKGVCLMNKDGGGELSIRLRVPAMLPDRRHRQENAILSSAQASGWRESEGRGQAFGGEPVRVSNRRTCQISDFPPPDSGVVPFSEKSPSPIKSDTTSLIASDYHSEALRRLHRPRYTWGENGILATMPTGLADSREPTPAFPGTCQGGRNRDRVGVSRAAEASQVPLPKNIHPMTQNTGVCQSRSTWGSAIQSVTPNHWPS